MECTRNFHLVLLFITQATLIALSVITSTQAGTSTSAPGSSEPSTTAAPTNATPTEAPTTTPPPVPPGGKCTSENSPPCDGNMICLTNGTCGCGSDNYLDGTNCLSKHAAGTPCMEDKQCVGNTTCKDSDTNKTCGCKDGFYVDGTQCLPKHAVGAPCTSNEQCVGTTTCVGPADNTTCGCEDSYYLEGTQCLARENPGEQCAGLGQGNCVSTAVCESDAAGTSGTCKIPVSGSCTNFDQHCVSGAECENDVCRKNPGEQCAGLGQGNCVSTAVCESDAAGTSGTCKIPVSGSCTNFDQHCVSGAECENNVCRKIPGEQCTGLGQGNCVSTAVCESAGTGTSGTCKIPVTGSCSNFVQHCVSGAECEKNVCKISVGEDCSANTDSCVFNTVCQRDRCRIRDSQSCNFTHQCVDNADCNGSSPTCSCRSDHYPVTNTGECKSRIAAGQFCTKDENNNPCVANANCVGAKCTCGDIYYNNNGSCALRKDYGAGCAGNECKAGFHCFNYGDGQKCSCPPEDFRDNNQCKNKNKLALNIRKRDDYKEREVTVEWDKPGGVQGTVSYTASLDGNVSSSNTSPFATFTGLDPGNQYNVTVTADIQKETHGTARINYTSQTFTAYTRPAKPGNLTEDRYPGPNVTLGFQKSDGRVQVYLVTLSPGGHSQTVTATAAGGAQTVTFPGLVEGAYYDVSITARITTHTGQNIDSQPNTDGRFRVRPDTPGIVSSLKLGSTYSRQIDVSWSKPAQPKGNMNGYIAAALRTNDMDRCDSVLVWTCSDCNSTTMSSDQNDKIQELNCSRKTYNSTIENNLLSNSYVFHSELTGLSPDDNYTIRVFPYNEEGEGSYVDTHATTQQERAADFDTLTATSPRVGELHVTWTPGERTGPTTYTVTWEEETGLDSSDYTHKGSHNVSGYVNTSYNITGLLSYWQYRVSVTAFTVVGESQNPPQPWVGRTMSSTPGPVQNLTIELDVDTATKVLLAFQCPTERERNADIKQFVYNSTVINTGAAGPNGEANLTGCGTKQKIRVTGVTAETNYTFNVFAKAGTLKGNYSTKMIYVEPKAPKLEPPAGVPAVIAKAEENPATQTSYKLKLCPQCLADDSQGQITFIALVVCKTEKDCNELKCKSDADRDKENCYRELPKWAEFKKDGYKGVYRPTPDNWTSTDFFTSVSARRKRSVEHLLHRVARAATAESGEYIVGRDTNCEQHPDTYCNGPLPSGQSFYVTAASCTRGGCTIVLNYVQITILTPINETPVAAIVSGVIVSLVVVAVIVVVVIFVMRRRRNGKQAGKYVEVDQTVVKPVRRPVKLKDFAAHLERLHKDSNLLFQQEFDEIQENSPKFGQDAACIDANKVKNRYVNILPFDHTRIKLNSEDDDECSDFINANYIPGYTSPREYIATQGPLTCTIDDFWRMIWEQKSSIIVMLSDLTEKGRAKVELYWPTEVNSPVQYGDIIVELTADSTLNKWTIRNFKILIENQEERRITQYFMPGWEDYGANLKPDDLLDFITMVRREARSSRGPITVHCSAGVGRTGTFIALDFLMQFVETHDLDAEVDIYNLVLNMRHNRPLMVQSEKQYVFIHDALQLIIERKIAAMEQAENENLYQNTGFQENIYANQAFEPEENLYENSSSYNKPTTVL